MKKILLLVLTINISLFSQVFAQESSDTTLIQETIANYLDGFYTGDEDRMEQALHPDLAKRIIYTTPNGRSYLQNMGSMSLYQYTKKKKDESEEHGDLDIKYTIYEIYGKIAIAKAETEHFDFIDFIQLAKVDGEWKIINVLWDKKIKENNE